jgi:hypothetical protein
MTKTIKAQLKKKLGLSSITPSLTRVNSDLISSNMFSWHLILEGKSI